MYRFVPILAALAVLLACAPGRAQTPMPKQVFKDWRYECMARDPNAGATAAPGTPPHVCMIQHDVRNGSGGLLLAARVRLIGAQKQPVLLLLLPPNLTVNASVGLSIDQAAPATTAVKECNARLCLAYVAIDDALLRALKAGQQLAVVTRPGGAESTQRVSLSGFTSAFSALQTSTP